MRHDRLTTEWNGIAAPTITTRHRRNNACIQHEQIQFYIQQIISLICRRIYLIEIHEEGQLRTRVVCVG